MPSASAAVTRGQRLFPAPAPVTIPIAGVTSGDQRVGTIEGLIELRVRVA
jgi:hypothetical protein